MRVRVYARIMPCTTLLLLVIMGRAQLNSAMLADVSAL